MLLVVVENYGVSLKKFLQQGILEPESYSDLAYKIRKLVEKSNFSELFRRKKVREESRECHNHKPQPFPDTKRKRKKTIPNKHKSNKRMKSTKISSLFPKQSNRNAKRTEKLKNKMTQGDIKQIAS